MSMRRRIHLLLCYIHVQSGRRRLRAGHRAGTAPPPLELEFEPSTAHARGTFYRTP